MATETKTHNDYTVGWVCALPKEWTAATAMLDQRHIRLPNPPTDSNTYTLGSIGKHNVVIACLPKGHIGNNSAATVATRMVSTFPSIKFGLMVGIGGGIPPKVRLGDVVVSTPVGQFPGVVQWDFGKANEDRFKRTGSLDNPPPLLLKAITELETGHEIVGSKIPDYLDELKRKWPRLAPKYLKSDSLKDVLFKADYSHVLQSPTDYDVALDSDDGSEEEESCQFCDKTKVLKRKPRGMRIHYGLIASGNRVIKSATQRDKLNKFLGGHLLCVEMDAVGLMNNFPCLVIRGICDYADSHKNKDWQEHAAAVAAAYAKELLEWVQPSDVEGERTAKDILGQVAADISKTGGDIWQITSDLHKNEDLKILEWITPVDYGPEQSDILKRRQEGTCQWFLDSAEYQAWITTKGQTLFCPGIPGAGKTILTSVVIDHLERKFQVNPTICIAYIYCNYKRREEQEIENLFASLLKQLSQGRTSLPDCVREIYNQYQRKWIRPSLNKILAALHSVTELYSRIFIIVDALDECHSSNGCQKRFITELLNLQKKCGVNIFTTSRFIPEIIDRFKANSVSLEIRASTGDVERYLKGHIEHLPTFIQGSQELQDKITTAISGAIDGMFLLAKIYLDYFKSMRTTKALKTALDQFQKLSPDSSEATQILIPAYKQNMVRIDGQQQDFRDLAYKILSWIVHAARLITKTELQQALAVEVGQPQIDKENLPSINDMVSVCAGLVTVDEESNVIQFAHYTALNYFNQARKHWFPNAEADVANICLTYVQFDTFKSGPCKTEQEFRERIQSNPLYVYAACNWGHHARKASRLLNKVTEFLECEEAINASLQAEMVYRNGSMNLYHLQNYPRHMTGLHLAAYFGIEETVRDLLGKGVDVDPKDDSRKTPLHWAAQSGHQAVVKLLILAGAHLNSKDNDGKIPLDWAVQLKHEAVAKLLLEADDPSITVEPGQFQHPNPESSRAGPPTDSGYASITHNKYGQTQNIIAEDDETQSTGNVEGLVADDMAEGAWAVHQEDDGASTIYSDSSILPASQRGNYISGFADKLFSTIPFEQLDEQILEEFSTILSEFLKAFAFKIGHNAHGNDAQSKMHRNVMVFIHRYRDDIVRQFRERVSYKKSTLDIRDHDSNNMPLEDKMSRWQQYLELEDSSHSDYNIDESDIANIYHSKSQIHENEATGGGIEGIFEEGDIGEDIREADGSELRAYQDFILNSQAYQWLLENISRQFLLAPAETDIMGIIRRNILHILPSSQKVSRNSAAQAYKMTFEIDWDLPAFFKEQEYIEEAHDVIERVIVLTGSEKDAQALTCAQYLLQTWPSTGEQIMWLLKGVLRNERQNTCVLPDGTKLAARLLASKLEVEAWGVGASVAEIGEQFAWLGAALRSSTYGTGVACCEPSLRINNPSQLPKIPPLTNISCEIKFRIDKMEERLELPNGYCWHNMFRNPVVVKGYPIKRRNTDASGLEIPLNIMAGLAQTQRIDTYNNKIFIKGFSTMLVPTMRSGDIILWHLLYNKEGNRISYLDDTNPRSENVTVDDVKEARHVLGWCSEARFYAGAVDANYHIGSCGPSKPHVDCILADTGVFRGRGITSGSQYLAGKKDTPEHISHREGDGYIPMLKWLAKKFVILWDEQDKRGWLVSGTSALLHLVRAFLVTESTDDFGDYLITKNDQILEDALKMHRANSANHILANDGNKKLKIYPEKDTYIFFEDQVKKFFNILEKLMDHQADIAGMNGQNLESLCVPRKHLEGWDFMTLVQENDPFYPRVTTLETTGKGWVDFTRAIHAVTLFGRGFGNIIQPANDTSCQDWAVLPKGKYYLATAMYDLRWIIKNRPMDNPRELGDNILWYNPDEILGSCKCPCPEKKGNCNPVQVLFPPSCSSALPLGSTPLELKDHGAVIFGHNDSFKWVWPDIGDPKEGELPPPSDDPETPDDSGIGTSLASPSISGRSEATPDLNSQQVVGSHNSSQLDSRRPAVKSCKEKKIFTDYTVGIICALSEELFAVRALFDEIHEKLSLPPHDSNQYALGQIAGHNVVAACLPDSNYGTNSAATVASHMCRSFLKVRFYLLVGIGGGIPSKTNDIRLGDVVVGTSAGVIQHDLGKSLEGTNFERKAHIRKPPRPLMTAISILKSEPSTEAAQSKMQDYIHAIGECDPKYKHPGKAHDRLFIDDYVHPQREETCTKCNGKQVKRTNRQFIHPIIHYGLIASGNQVIKDTKIRNRLRDELKATCVEMEAAGVAEAVQCLVIRGICDYADSHKNDIWHKYAAATAAAYAKVLLSYVSESIADDLDNGRIPKRRRKISTMCKIF